ncbi:hypothetical protein [Paenibacillus amylolyticus]|uniref:hypothetical protein n=1 Tax=Paenibacillus amylolyticus TaxID=1451 RepID=UPI003EBD9235
MEFEAQYGLLFRDWTLVLQHAKQIRLLTDEQYAIRSVDTIGRPTENTDIQFILGVSGEGEVAGVGRANWTGMENK